MSCHTSHGTPCDPDKLPCCHIVCAALVVNKRAVHLVCKDAQLAHAWFPSMYHVDTLIALHDAMPPIDCAQGENAVSSLQGPTKVKRSLPYSSKRYRSRFQEANNDTSGKKVGRLTGKKRGREDDDGDGTLTFWDKASMIEFGNYRAIPANMPSELNAYASDSDDNIRNVSQHDATASVAPLPPSGTGAPQTADVSQPESESTLTSWLYTLIGR